MGLKHFSQGFLWFLPSHLRLFPFMQRIPFSGFKRVLRREQKLFQSLVSALWGRHREQRDFRGPRPTCSPPRELTSTKRGWRDGQSSVPRWSGVGHHGGGFLSGPRASFLGERTPGQSGDPFIEFGTVEITLNYFTCTRQSTYGMNAGLLKFT